MVIKLTWKVIKFNSVTSAMQAQNTLKKHGIKSQIEHSLQKNTTKGCGYILRVAADKKSIEKILDTNKFVFLDN